LFVTSPHVKAGDLGLPTPGMTIKLVQSEGKTEIRYRGPNITTGYWRMADATKDAFDEEGFFKTGDAVKWIDEGDIHQGLKFDGRIAEDFKLATGTFVSVGPLRARIAAAFAPGVQDAVITGLNEHEVGALLIPTPGVRRLAGLSDAASMAEVLASPAVQQLTQAALAKLAESATGSASRVTRVAWLEAPPSLDAGEITDKGSINQRAVLDKRVALVQALYSNTAPHMFTLDPPHFSPQETAA
jgi:feruloyl-CoA synthase